ncbi:MAG: formate dehydrogenase [Burkholderiales bacterium]|nr:formate dehydrogenase [Burkholderiales bacterium]
MSEKAKLSRRKFLLAAGAGSAATVAAIAAKTVPQAETAAAGTGATKRKGYQLSEHVRRYYETTKV